MEVDALNPVTTSDDCFDLGRLSDLATVVHSVDGNEHVVISDGQRRIRIDVMAGSLLNGPVLLQYQLQGIAQLDQKPLALRRLAALHRYGKLLPSLFPVSSRAKSVVSALRVHDALVDGASQRDVAYALFGREAVNSDWAGRSDYLRSKVRRLIALARRLGGGEWQKLLL